VLRLLLSLLRVDIFSDCCSMHIQPISMLIGSLCRLFRWRPVVKQPAETSYGRTKEE